MYGYYVFEKWLHETALRFISKLRHDLLGGEAWSNANSNPSYSFTVTFRIYSLGTSLAYPPPGQIVPAECTVDGWVYVLYICTNEPDSYRWRPTQKQGDGLTKFEHGQRAAVADRYFTSELLVMTHS